jgi:hypothetical protein
MQSMESIVAVDAWARSEAESRAGGDLR